MSSRNDQDIAYKLEGYPNLELSSDRNSSDINKFVELMTSSLIETGDLLRFSSIKQQLKEEIIRKSVIGCSGHVE